ncbi:MAG: hypothetical protein ACRD03_06205 [Acidimicrobiales bacterium]
MAGPYKSEREHTAYLRAFRASASPLCMWCREAAGVAALAALPPVAALPTGAIERLAVLLRHPHDYPSDSWEQTIRQQGGVTAVLQMIAPRLPQQKSPREFEGRKKGEVLIGVSLSRPGTDPTYEVIDGAGAVWTVRGSASRVMRKRQGWTWEPTPEERVAQLLPRILELAAR